MRAGPLRYMLEVYKPEYETTATGAERVTYGDEPWRTVHAERVNMRGKYGDEVGEHFPGYTTEWNVREVHRIRENWRVKEKGGYLYNVQSVIPNISRGFVTLVCERVNP